MGIVHGACHVSAAVRSEQQPISPSSWRVAGRGVLDKPDESEATLEDGMRREGARAGLGTAGLANSRARAQT